MASVREMSTYELIKALKERGLTLRELAEILGIPEKDLTNYVVEAKFRYPLLVAERRV